MKRRDVYAHDRHVMTDRRGVLLAELKREHRAGRVFLSNYRYHATPKVLLGCKATIKAYPSPRLSRIKRNRLVPFPFELYRYRVPSSILLSYFLISPLRSLTLASPNRRQLGETWKLVVRRSHDSDKRLRLNGLPPRGSNDRLPHWLLTTLAVFHRPGLNTRDWRRSRHVRRD